MRDELFELVVDLLFEKVGYKCQPSELEELAAEITDAVIEKLE